MSPLPDVSRICTAFFSSSSEKSKPSCRLRARGQGHAPQAPGPARAAAVRTEQPQSARGSSQAFSRRGQPARGVAHAMRMSMAAAQGAASGAAAGGSAERAHMSLRTSIGSSTMSSFSSNLRVAMPCSPGIAGAHRVACSHERATGTRAVPGSACAPGRHMHAARSWKRPRLLNTVAISAAWSLLRPYLPASKPPASAFCRVRNVLRLFSGLCRLPPALPASSCDPCPPTQGQPGG